jgi:hypothetical protein
MNFLACTKRTRARGKPAARTARDRENFNGSFNRESSTAQDGTTPGALLWEQWHRGRYGCAYGETPVMCELRTHRPSFVIIQIGSHFESRNTEYLRRIINQLLEKGVVPILATKADNRELDHRVNRDMALLASEFNLPLWNFWASLNDLPNRGLYTRKDRPLQGDIYLTEEAQDPTRHRLAGAEHRLARRNGGDLRGRPCLKRTPARGVPTFIIHPSAFILSKAAHPYRTQRPAHPSRRCSTYPSQAERSRP